MWSSYTLVSVFLHKLSLGDEWGKLHSPLKLSGSLTSSQRVAKMLLDSRHSSRRSQIVTPMQAQILKRSDGSSSTAGLLDGRWLCLSNPLTYVVFCRLKAKHGPKNMEIIWIRSRILSFELFRPHKWKRTRFSPLLTTPFKINSQRLLIWFWLN